MHRLNVYTREGAAVIMSRYALRCISYDYKQPTTTRGMCIDQVFANFRMYPLEEPLKGKRKRTKKSAAYMRRRKTTRRRDTIVRDVTKPP